MAGNGAWWRGGVIYQILLRSFQDSSGDGNGDLHGLETRLDYLQSLGVDALWLTPIHPSPLHDGGYDISDFDDVHPMYGDMETFMRVLEGVHARGMKLILDWVPNHSSDQHPWFQASRSSRDDPKRDWYVWADPGPDGGPPNNWLSVFGGSAWTMDEGTGQYFYHAFLPEQPDLNWRNPEVRGALCASMRTWLERGVDGFRLDALDMLLETEGLPDNPVNEAFDPEHDAPDRAVLHEHTRDIEELHGIAADLRRVTDEFEERVLLGEMYIPAERVVRYYGSPEQPELHLPLNLALLHADWDADVVMESIDSYAALVPEHGTAAWSLGNHDIGRLATRLGPAQARVAAMLLLTQAGTCTLYYGDEIAMQDGEIPPGKQQDPQGAKFPRLNRDPARTPMQWSTEPNAGFTTGEPWLPVRDTGALTVEAQERNGCSPLALYRRLIALRRGTLALRNGVQTGIPREAPFVAYLRACEEERLLVLLNLSGESHSFDFGDHAERGEVLLSTMLDREDETVEAVVAVRGDEGLIVRLL